MSTTGSGRTVHWATGLLHPIQKNHGLRASLRFARRPWFQGSHRKWYNYRGQVTLANSKPPQGFVDAMAKNLKVLLGSAAAQIAEAVTRHHQKLANRP